MLMKVKYYINFYALISKFLPKLIYIPTNKQILSFTNVYYFGLRKKRYIFAVMNNGIYQSLLDRKLKQKKSFAVLVDPDKVNDKQVLQLTELCNDAQVDYLLVGGSLVVSDYLDQCIQITM
jgi:hypothetical protein